MDGYNGKIEPASGVPELANRGLQKGYVPYDAILSGDIGNPEAIAARNTINSAAENRDDITVQALQFDKESIEALETQGVIEGLKSSRDGELKANWLVEVNDDDVDFDFRFTLQENGLYQVSWKVGDSSGQEHLEAYDSYRDLRILTTSDGTPITQEATLQALFGEEEAVQQESEQVVSSRVEEPERVDSGFESIGKATAEDPEYFKELEELEVIEGDAESVEDDIDSIEDSNLELQGTIAEHLDSEGKSLINFYLSAEYLESHKENYRSQLEDLVANISEFESTDLGKAWLSRFESKNEDEPKKLTIPELADIGLSGVGSASSLSDSARVLIVLDDTIEGSVATPQHVKRGTDYDFTIIRVNPAQLDTSISGLSHSTELLVRLVESSHLQNNNWINPASARQLVNNENKIREQLNLPGLDFSGESVIQTDSTPRRIGVEQELLSYRVVRKGAHSTNYYRGVALVTEGEEAGFANFSVTLDTSTTRGSLIEIVSAPFETDNYLEGFIHQQATQLLQTVLSELVSESGSISFDALEKRYNQRLSELDDGSDIYQDYRLKSVRNGITSKLGESGIDSEEFTVEPFEIKAGASNTRVQTSIAFEYGRLGDPLSGLDELVGRRQSLRLAQVEAAQWASSITENPSAELKAFLTHTLYSELGYLQTPPGKNYDKTKFLELIRSDPSDAVASVLSYDDILLLAATGKDRLIQDFTRSLNQIKGAFKNADKFRDIDSADGLFDRAESVFSDAIAARIELGKFLIPETGNGFVVPPGSRDVLVLSGNSPSRVPILQSEDGTAFTVLEVREKNHPVSKLATTPLTENPYAALLEYLQDPSSLGSESKTNDAYIQTVRRVFDKLSGDETLDGALDVVRQRLNTDIDKLSNTERQSLLADFIRQADASDAGEFSSNPANQVIATTLSQQELQGMGSDFLDSRTVSLDEGSHLVRALAISGAESFHIEVEGRKYAINLGDDNVLERSLVFDTEGTGYPQREEQSLSLKDEVRELFSSRQDNELVEILSTEYLNELTTKADESKRLTTFDSLSEILTETFPDQTDRVESIIDRVETAVGQQLNNSIKILNNTSREQIEQNITRIEARLQRLTSSQPVDESSVRKFEAELDEFTLAREMLDAGVSAGWAPVKGLIPVKAPELWELRDLLADDQQGEAAAFIQSQSSAQTVQQLLTLLEQGHYEKTLIDLTRNFLASFESSNSENDQPGAEQEPREDVYGVLPEDSSDSEGGSSEDAQQEIENDDRGNLDEPRETGTDDDSETESVDGELSDASVEGQEVLQEQGEFTDSDDEGSIEEATTANFLIGHHHDINKAPLVGIIAPPEFYKRYGEEATGIYLQTLSKHIRNFEKTATGRDWLNQLKRKSAQPFSPVSLDELYEERVSDYLGDDADLPPSTRVLIVFDEKLQGAVSQPKWLESSRPDIFGVEKEFAVVRVNPGKLGRSKYGYQNSSELFAQLTEIGNIQTGSWDGEITDKEFQSLENKIRRELRLPVIDFEAKSQIFSDQNPVRIGFEREIVAYHVTREGVSEHEKEQYRGTALYTAGSELGHNLLSVTLDTSINHGSSIELISAPLSHENYSEGAPNYRVTELFHNVLDDLMKGAEKLSFRDLKDTFNKRLKKQFGPESEVYRDYQLLESESLLLNQYTFEEASHDQFRIRRSGDSALEGGNTKSGLDGSKQSSLYYLARNGEVISGQDRYKGRVLRSVGKDQGFAHLSVTLDTGHDDQPPLDIIASPFSSKSSSYDKISKIFSEILAETLDKGQPISFDTLKITFNDELERIFGRNSEIYREYQLETVSGGISNLGTGEKGIEFEEFSVFTEAAKEEKIEESAPIGVHPDDDLLKFGTQTNISFEYSRIGDALSGIDQLVGSREWRWLQYAQSSASQWANELTQNPSGNLKAFLAHAIYTELTDGSFLPGTDFDKVKLKSLLRSSPADAVLTILSEEDIALLSETSYGILADKFYEILDNGVRELNLKGQYTDGSYIQSVQSRTTALFYDAIKVRQDQGRVQLGFDEVADREAAVPGTRTSLVIGGSFTSRRAIQESDGEFYTILEVRQLRHEVHRIAITPLEKNALSGLVGYFQDSSSLGTNTAVNEAYLSNVRRLFDQFSEQDRHVVYDQINHDTALLDKNNRLALQRVFLKQLDEDIPTSELVTQKLATAFVGSAIFNSEIKLTNDILTEDLSRLIALADAGEFRVADAAGREFTLRLEPKSGLDVSYFDKDSGVLTLGTADSEQWNSEQWTATIESILSKTHASQPEQTDSTEQTSDDIQDEAGEPSEDQEYLQELQERGIYGDDSESVADPDDPAASEETSSEISENEDTSALDIEEASKEIQDSDVAFETGDSSEAVRIENVESENLKVDTTSEKSASPIENDVVLTPEIEGFKWLESGKLAGMPEFARSGPENARAVAVKLFNSNIRTVISLESEKASLVQASTTAASSDMEWYSSFLKDWHAPSVEQLQAFVELVDERVQETGAGVAVHCLASHGRTGTFLAAYLIHSKVAENATEALRIIRSEYSGNAVEVKTQYNALARFSDYLGRSPSLPVNSQELLTSVKGVFASEEKIDKTLDGDSGLIHDPGHKGDPTSHFLTEEQFNKVVVGKNGLKIYGGPYISKNPDSDVPSTLEFGDAAISAVIPRWRSLGEFFPRNNLFYGSDESTSVYLKRAAINFLQDKFDDVSTRKLKLTQEEIESLTSNGYLDNLLQINENTFSGSLGHSVDGLKRTLHYVFTKTSNDLFQTEVSVSSKQNVDLNKLPKSYDLEEVFVLADSEGFLTKERVRDALGITGEEHIFTAPGGGDIQKTEVTDVSAEELEDIESTIDDDSNVASLEESIKEIQGPESDFVLTSWGKAGLVGFYASPAFIEWHGHDVVIEKIRSLSAFLKEFETTDLGEEWLSRVEEKNAASASQITLDELASQNDFDVPDVDLQLPQSMRFLIDFDITLEEPIGGPDIHQSQSTDSLGVKEEFAIIKVNPNLLDDSDDGLFQSVELMATLMDVAGLMTGSQNELLSQKGFDDLQEQIRIELGFSEAEPEEDDNLDPAEYSESNTEETEATDEEIAQDAAVSETSSESTQDASSSQAQGDEIETIIDSLRETLTGELVTDSSEAADLNGELAANTKAALPINPDSSGDSLIWDDAAIEGSGIPEDVVRSWIEIARQTGSLIAVRPVNKNSAELLANGLGGEQQIGTKGINVHAKSAVDGLEAGLVPAEAELSKVLGNADAVERGNANILESLDEPGITSELLKMDLATAQRRLKSGSIQSLEEGENGVYLATSNRNVNGEIVRFDYQLTPDSSEDSENTLYTVSRRSEQYAQLSGNEAFADFRTVKVLAENGNLLTADVDLYGLFGKLNDVRKVTLDGLVEAALATSDEAGAATPGDAVEARRRVVRARWKAAYSMVKNGLGQRRRSVVDPVLGRLTDYQKDLIDQLNGASEVRLINHGTEQDNTLYPEKDDNVLFIDQSGSCIPDPGIWSDCRSSQALRIKRRFPDLY